MRIFSCPILAVLFIVVLENLTLPATGDNASDSA